MLSLWIVKLSQLVGMGYSLNHKLEIKIRNWVVNNQDWEDTCVI